jgi:hypothetical protein
VNELRRRRNALPRNADALSCAPMSPIADTRSHALIRWVLPAVLALAVAGIVLWLLRARDDAVAIVGEPAGAFAASAADAQPAAPPVAAVQDGAVSQSPAAASAVGEASGTVRIAGDNGRTYELQVRHAVAVWQPGQSRLRIALSADLIDYTQATYLLDTLAGEGMAARAGAPAAMLELVFMPSAQAFTQDELERADLLVRNSSGSLVQAEVLGTLQWSGSLPSPQVGAAALLPSQVEMKLIGQGFPADSSAPRPSWNLSLSVPAGLRW